MTTARNLLTSLVAGAPPEPDLAFQISLLDIEYHTILGNLDIASELISKLENSVKHEDADVYQQIHLMILRAMLFAKSGISEKGFSITVRAAAVSYRARIVPALWESVGALANILISLKEWDAARMILNSIIPQVCQRNSIQQFAKEIHRY
jgi:anaphase-promoting complex subunit 5